MNQEVKEKIINQEEEKLYEDLIEQIHKDMDRFIKKYSKKISFNIDSDSIKLGYLAGLLNISAGRYLKYIVERDLIIHQESFNLGKGIAEKRKKSWEVKHENQ